MAGGKAVLRDYINATVGFKALGKAISIETKSIMRMFGRRGNPQAQNLFEIVVYLQQKEHVHLQVKARAAGR